MTEQKIEPTIEHLDFKEEEHTCTLISPRPDECGRPAIYLVHVSPGCGCEEDIYVCRGHWSQVSLNPQYKWRCLIHNVRYPALDHMTRWERIK